MMEKVSSSVRFAGNTKRGLAMSLLGGLLSFSLFALSALLILSLLAYKNADPTRLIAPLSYAALAAGAFVFGLSSSKLRGKQGALVGLVSGMTLAALVYIISFAINRGNSATPLTVSLCLYAIIIALAVLGGLAGAQKKSAKKKRRRR